MKKIFSIFLVALIATSVSANGKVWYCDPAATQDGQGTSWDDAVTVSTLRSTLNGTSMKGDIVYIKGGTIKISQVSDIWMINNSVTLIGGFDPDATGTVTDLPIYPSTTPTIFDGDANSNGKPDAGDAEALIRVNLEKSQEDTVVLQGLVLRNTYHYLQGESNKDVDTYMDTTAALRLICGVVYVKSCEIYNNFSKHRGSQTVTIVGAKAHFMDCDLHHGVSESRGGLIRSRDYFINGVDSTIISPSLVLERCCLHESSALGGKKINANGTYGGAVHATSGELFAINSTFVLDSCYSKGGALRGNKPGITLISCTLGQNFGTRADTTDKACSYGSSIGLDGDVPIRFMNTIVLDDKDKDSKATTPIYTDGNNVEASKFFFSNDYNILGSIYIYVKGGKQNADTIAALMKSNDRFNVKDSAFTTIFGDVYTNLKNNGGFAKSIMPLEMLNGASVSALQDYANTFCPSWTRVDASLDQRGYQRQSTQVCVGAADPQATPILQTSIRETVKDQSGCTKIIKGSQLLIIRDGKTYNAQGVRL